MNNKLWHECRDCGELWCVVLAAAHDCEARRQRIERELKERAQFVGPFPANPYDRLRRQLKEQ